MRDPGCAGRWVALRLSDGGSDGNVYDTRPDAIRHQADRKNRMYLKIPPDGLTPEDGSRLLLLWRMFVDNGFELLDPDDQREPIMPYTTEDLTAHLAAARARK